MKGSRVRLSIVGMALTVAAVFALDRGIPRHQRIRA